MVMIVRVGPPLIRLLIVSCSTIILFSVKSDMCIGSAHFSNVSHIIEILSSRVRGSVIAMKINPIQWQLQLQIKLQLQLRICDGGMPITALWLKIVEVWLGVVIVTTF